MAKKKDIRRHTVRCSFRCKHCRQIIGAENIAHYAREAPGYTQPTWFFAAMILLDHLRDCQERDYADELRARYGADFLTHPDIHEFFTVHALVERHLVKQEDLDEAQ